MKLAMFGATGRTGLPLVEQALAQGHEVVVLVRSPEKMNTAHANLRVVQGDATNPSDVAKIITPDVDAVLSVVGPVPGGADDLMPKLARGIVQAMRASNVRRLMFMTGAGVDFPQDKPSFFDHVIVALLKLFSPKVLEQSIQGVQVVREANDLDWTVVRGPRLTEGAKTGQVKHGYKGSGVGTSVIRADVAHWMLQHLADSSTFREGPVLSN